ncbi:MAG: MarR family transcriptional regulator [Nakamurella sp.]
MTGHERPRDVVDESLWRPLRQLMSAMDDDIARLYQERGVGIQTSQSMVLLRLDTSGPMTIRELARSLEITHSGAGQKVKSLLAAGHVTTVTGPDLRTKLVSLTQQGRELVPFLAAEWQATERAAAALEEELPYALSAVVNDMRIALRRRSFHDRITAELAQTDDRTEQAGSHP